MASEMFPRLKIPLEDIVKATNNFHPDNKIGHGDFGPAYVGQLLQSGELMKITARRLDRKHGLGGFEFLNELSMLSNLKHTNIVSIIGFCEEKGEQIIVTTHEANGSLERFLDSPSLTWTQRLRICIGVARALSYLHFGQGHGYGVIHRLVNSSTVLLDEDWEAKLSGFEISIKQSQGQVNPSDHLVGTTGYFDPAMIKAKGVTYKSDIYSFGIVLFEILCGRKAYVQNVPNMFLDPLAKYHYENKTLQNIVHPDLWKEMSPESLLVYSKVAYSCLEDYMSVRPDMDYIVAQLEKALKAQTRRENIVRHFIMFSF